MTPVLAHLPVWFLAQPKLTPPLQAHVVTVHDVPPLHVNANVPLLSGRIQRALETCLLGKAVGVCPAWWRR